MASTSPDSRTPWHRLACNRATADLDPLRFRRRDSGGPSLVLELKKQLPNFRIAISTTTLTGKTLPRDFQVRC